MERALAWWKRPRKERKRQSEDGSEIPDSTPMEPPLGFVETVPLSQQIRDMVRSERLAQEAEAAGFETFEEADDFDVGDDLDLPNTPYEQEFDPTPVGELRRRREEAEEQARKESDGDGGSQEEPPQNESEKGETKKKVKKGGDKPPVEE